MTRPRVRSWPTWWGYELELTPHLLKRMIDRGFSEVDLRRMLEVAEGFQPDPLQSRWQIMTRHLKSSWVVVVEPDEAIEQLVVITAYRAE